MAGVFRSRTECSQASELIRKLAALATRIKSADKSSCRLKQKIASRRSLVVDRWQCDQTGAFAVFLKFLRRDSRELNFAKIHFELAARKWRHENVFQPFDVLVGEVAPIVGAAGLLPRERAASEHLGHETEVFRVNGFVPRRVVHGRER